jgi:hypothetical protein
MKSFRLTLAAGILAAAISSMAPAQPSYISKPTQAAASPAGLPDFAFLIGEWSVHHRKLKAGSHEWVEFDGTCSNRALMDGWANMEEHILNSPTGAYRAIALRSYDSKTGEWAIWWLDGRYPSGPLDPPVKGRFESGVGTFYSDYMNNGKPERVRFIWSHITPTSARWEQALSADAGKTWETNWIMEFRRKANPGASAGQGQSGVDGSEVAKVIVKRALETRAGERVVLMCSYQSC